MSQCSKLSQSTAIVAKKPQLSNSNHNCRNTNHKGGTFFEKHIAFLKYWLCTKLWQFIQFSTIVASQLNYENCGILWHTMSLSYNCRNLDIYFDRSKRSETKFGTALTICVHVTVNLKYIIHYGSLLYWRFDNLQLSQFGYLFWQ